MNKKEERGYVAGAISGIMTLLLFIVGFSSGWNIQGQTVTGIAFLFLIGSILSFKFPNSAGQIVHQLLDNLTSDSTNESSVKQSQHKPSRSPQINSMKGDIHYH